jgi:uncharacterized protein (UPF0332 family)
MLSKRKLEVESYKFISRGYRSLFHVVEAKMIGYLQASLRTSGLLSGFLLRFLLRFLSRFSNLSELCKNTLPNCLPL